MLNDSWKRTKGALSSRPFGMERIQGAEWPPARNGSLPKIRPMARRTAGCRPNQSQTAPVLRFSAERSVIPRLIPTTSGFTHCESGWNESEKPYPPYTIGPNDWRIVRSAAIERSGVNIKDPPAAQGTTVPSRSRREKPPQPRYPISLSDGVTPQRFSEYAGNMLRRLRQNSRCARVAVTEFSK